MSLPSIVRLVALALLCGTVLQAQPAQPGYILLRRVTGDVIVEARNGGTRQDARDVSQIQQQTVVTTGASGSVVLVFSNGSTISLGADSSLDVEEFMQDPFADVLRPSEMTAEPTISRTNLNLSRGELVGNVKLLRTDAGSSFTVQTPAGVAGIRGTTFRIVFRTDDSGATHFSLTTLEGMVGFVTAGGTLEEPLALVTNGEEVVVEVEIDDDTGQVTVLTPMASIVPTAAPTASIQAIVTAAESAAYAAVDLLLPPPVASEPTAGSPPAVAAPSEETEPPANGAPSAHTTPPAPEVPTDHVRVSPSN